MPFSRQGSLTRNIAMVVATHFTAAGAPIR
jgi:hypothetical protein